MASKKKANMRYYRISNNILRHKDSWTCQKLDLGKT